MSNQSTNGWNPNGGSTSTIMRFKNYTLNNDISCANETDQFAVGNNKAKLTYPVALATHEELYTLTNNNTLYNPLTKTTVHWWGLSPDYFNNSNASVRYVNTFGNVNNGEYVNVSEARGARPVVTLSPATLIVSGDGSTSNPFVIQE